MESGIYKIHNKVNDKMYIGQAINVKKRLKNHLMELRNNNHNNMILQRDFNEYKEENFQFEKIYDCEEEFLNPMEQYFIKKYNTTNEGYNIMNGNSVVNKRLRIKEEIKKRNETMTSFVNSKLGPFNKEIDIDINKYMLYVYGIKRFWTNGGDDSIATSIFVEVLNKILIDIYTKTIDEYKRNVDISELDMEIEDIIEIFRIVKVEDNNLISIVPYVYILHNNEGEKIQQIGITKYILTPKSNKKIK